MSSGQDDVDGKFVPERPLRIEINPVSATKLTRYHHHICGVSVPMLGMMDAELNKMSGLPARGTSPVVGQTSKQTMPLCYRHRRNRLSPGEEEPDSPVGGRGDFPEEVHFRLGIERWLGTQVRNGWA